MDLADAWDLGGWLAKVRLHRPLVHNITNFVAMQFSANVLLSVGASPVMAHAAPEVAEMAAQADGLVLNIGTLEPDWVTAMETAAAAAHAHGKPVVLDPVGVGATAYRTDTAHRLLDTAHPTAVRGNASEIGVLVGTGGDVRGVDAAGAQLPLDALATWARRRHCLVIATGAVDIATDGDRVVRVFNGHERLQQVTATGCSLSALVGAFLAVAVKTEGRPLEAVTSALAYFGAAGERAAAQARGPGSFAVALLDELAAYEPAALNRDARVTMD